MSLNGPELDLLLEVLDEDPAADVYLMVATSLLEAGRAEEATTILRRAVEHGADDPESARLLARAASQTGDDAGVRLAAARLGEDTMRGEPALARAWAIALDRAGDLDRAAQVARAVLERGGADPELAAILEREQAPPPPNDLRARDPRFTVNLAEAYLEAGRGDLAVRAYRRVLARHPDNASVHARLLRLHALPRGDRPWVDDLSEEYWVRRAPPPLLMPTPSLVPSGEPDDELTQPGAPSRVMSQGESRVRGDDEDTSIVARAGVLVSPEPAKQRRSDPRGETWQKGRENDLRSQPRIASPVLDDEDETTVVPRLDFASLGDPPSDNDTVLLPRIDVGSSTGAPLRRSLPGADALRRALSEERLDDEDGDAFDEEGDPDDIIEQARAIERAADKRRRTLLRK